MWSHRYLVSIASTAGIVALVLGTSLASPTTARGAGSSSYVYLTQWGSKGGFDGQFASAPVLALDATGDVFVLDSGNDRIEEFSNTGAYLTQWGSFGSGPGQFNNPQRIAIDHVGNIFVTDTNNGRVQKFDAQGTFLSQFAVPPYNAIGIAVDSQNNVYIADDNDNVVQKYDSAGNFLLQWGSTGSGPGQFREPYDLAVDTQDNVYVIDYANYRVEKFDTVGIYLSQFGGQGTGDGLFSAPDGIGTDPTGDVFVSDTSDNRVEKFSPSGVYEDQFGTQGSGNGQLLGPMGVTADAGGNVYIADISNYRVEVFTNNPPSPTPTPTRPATATVRSTRVPTLTPSATPTVSVALPDLQETALSNPPATVAAGASLKVSDTVTNYGTATAVQSTTRFYLSSTGLKGKDSLLLTGSRTVPNLRPGASSTGFATVIVSQGTAAGTYFVLACADDLRNVTESNETNNCRRSTTKTTILSPVSPTTTATATATNSPTATTSSTPTPSATPTDAFTITPTNTPTATSTLSATSSPTATDTPTVTASLTSTVTSTTTVTVTTTGTPTDTLTPTETAVLTPSDTPTDTPTSTPSNTPIITPTSTPIPNPIQNGDFESGFSGWTLGETGGVALPQLTTSFVHSGRQAALLGNPSYPCSGEPIGSSSVSQAITLPAGAAASLTMSFDLSTYDHTVDDFAVYIQTATGPATQIYVFGTSNKNQAGCASTNFKDFGWQTVTVPIPSSFEGQVVTLKFANELQTDGFYDTWTYLDDVSVAFAQ